MEPYLLGPGNASSVHAHGRAARLALTGARRRIAAALEVPRDAVIFTGNGSEANLLALEGTIRQLPPDRRHVLTSTVEHPSVLQTLERLAESGEVELDKMPTDRGGRLSATDLQNCLRADTGLVSLMLANNELGTLQPLADLHATLADRDIVFHSDAAQAIGKVPAKPRQLGASLLTFAPHKFGGPRGVGVLLNLEDRPLQSPLSAGRQEAGLRGGTESVAHCVGAAVALELALAQLYEENQRLLILRAQLLQNLLGSLADLAATESTLRIPELVIHSPSEDVLPGTLSFSIGQIPGPWLVAQLDRRGFSVSHGSACSSLAALPSHVLVAIGAKMHAKSAVRISFGWETQAQDLADFVRALRASVREILVSQEASNSALDGASPHQI
jgi:cysteine desulfurase